MEPRTGGLDPDSTPPGRLTWRMARVDFGGGWSWKELADDQLANLRRVLAEYETSDLHALRHDARIREIPVSDMCEEARARLVDLQQEDLDSLWELRLGIASWRVWGVLDRSTFDLLWWDPNHTVCTGRDRARGRGRG
jgi:hypothetical protein